MNVKKLEHFKNLLLKEKQEIVDTLRRMEEHQPHSGSMKEYTEELSAYDNHPADLGTEMFMTSMQANLENNEKYRLHEIDRALKRIENDEYGICRDCSGGISEERLEILPEADTCMECEKGKVALYDSSSNRPVEERLLRPPFGRTHKNTDDYTGYDGEDAYQEVAKYNEVKSDPSFSTGDNQGVFDDDSLGIVEGTDKITEGHYKSQIPGTTKERKGKKDSQ
ncbi:TraR/DksA C4-type zinc finger protein [Natronincola ferrireducens]|uniref:Transcriptional regulator, TraR/DksA family n=1 Tax=Natronincola ferrireducens TaxID=393762 RepID=A0A1G9BSE4_9FIRM|nr:TraR/DksA C4-type zinc finger protein [Natronincola ferrireducens]SDK42366.1 transcriptional regulator, TraR/DksA family [Natronincola ferrireducens]